MLANVVLGDLKVSGEFLPIYPKNEGLMDRTKTLMKRRVPD